MFQKLFTRRRGVAIATVALGLSGMSMVFTGTAGAVGQPFSVLPGGGSNTAYQVMTSLSTLFNQSPGCDLAGTSKPKTGVCANPYTPARPVRMASLLPRRTPTTT